MSDEDDLIEDGVDDDDEDTDCGECGLPLEDCECNDILTGDKGDE